MKLRQMIEGATQGPFWEGNMIEPDGYAMAWFGNWFVDTKAPKRNLSRYGDSECDAKLTSVLLNNAPALADIVEAARILVANRRVEWKKGEDSDIDFLEDRLSKLSEEFQP